jgi:hypothetical protein
VAAPSGETEVKTDSSLRFVQAGNVANFSIVATDIGDPARFDFYAFIEIGDEEVDKVPSHLFFSAQATYPKEALAPGAPYPVETYEDNQDARIDLGVILFGVLGLLGFGAVLALGGWAFQRLRSTKS